MVISRDAPRLAVWLIGLLALASWAAPARADCQSDPRAVPHDLAVQLAAIDALIDGGCYKEAVPILETGLSQHPHSSELQSRMRAVRSMLNEEQFFEGLGTAQEKAKLQHDAMRCTKFFDVNACDDALRSKPDDPELLVAKGDALSHEGRPADAILIYLHAGGLLPPGDEGIKLKLSAAEAQREGLAAQCQVSADAAAADACQAALLRGSTDEFTLLKRRGILLQSFDKPAQALDAFIAASVLKQDDKAVALAVVALTDSTGRKDALALAARGNALLLLGRPSDARQALRQAEALTPSLPGIKGQIAKAEQGAREEARRQVKVASNKPAVPEAPAPHPKPQPAAARVAEANAVTYSNDASAAQSN